MSTGSRMSALRGTSVATDLAAGVCSMCGHLKKSKSPRPAVSENQQIWHELGDEDKEVWYERPTDLAEVWENSIDSLAPFKHDRATLLHGECETCKTQGDSLDFEKFLDDEVFEDRNAPVPEHLICFLKLALHDARETDTPPQRRRARHIRLRPLRLRWLDMSAYCGIVHRMQKYVDSRPPTPKRAYLRSTRVSLHERRDPQFEEMDSCVVSKAAEWDYVLRMICRYCAQDPCGDAPRPFCLQIECSFEWFSIEPYRRHQGRQFDESVRRVLDETKMSNLEPKGYYWSRKLLRVLFDRDTIHHLIKDHFTNRRSRKGKTVRPGPSGDQLDELVNWLVNDSHGILATTIQAGIKLDFVHRLMMEDRSINDKMIPLGKDRLRNVLDRHQMNDFLRLQGSFRPISFDKPNRLDYVHEHKVFSDDQALPISFEGEISGSIHKPSKVFAVKIHPEFHAFSCTEGGKFAVKQIIESALNDPRMEANTWQLIAKRPHRHITGVFASWSQKGHLYMLSPLADGNLNDFMRKENPLDVSKDSQWFLEQLHGLVSGVRHIHTIGRATLKEKDHSGKVVDCGYHLDLKPDNILVFDRVFKISDFGTAKLRAIVSRSADVPSFYTEKIAGGDVVYSGPDWDIVRKVGRPYDIWSLGCIFLEIFLWAFGEGKKLDAFTRERRRHREDHCGCEELSLPESRHDPLDDDDFPDLEYPNFWYRCRKARNFHLKKCVEEKVKWINDEAENLTYTALDGETLVPCKLFVRLCLYVRNMLEVVPRDRHKASVIRDEIAILRLRARAHFSSKSPLSGQTREDDGRSLDLGPQPELESNLDVKSSLGSPRGGRSASLHRLKTDPFILAYANSANTERLEVPTPMQTPSISISQVDQGSPSSPYAYPQTLRTEDDEQSDDLTGRNLKPDKSDEGHSVARSVSSSTADRMMTPQGPAILTPASTRSRRGSHASTTPAPDTEQATKSEDDPAWSAKRLLKLQEDIQPESDSSSSKYQKPFKEE